ncbi:hypothetical protein [Coraliomargarita parva]|uniref:hypothetical protein n=1 Tax=Coraliomargarita parva TaxID=3014050 RepID=UPI0022B59139|nr:hypothetical protein [Coraliomargarita parva]
MRLPYISFRLALRRADAGSWVSPWPAPAERPGAEAKHIVTGIVLGRDPADADARAAQLEAMLV